MPSNGMPAPISFMRGSLFIFSTAASRTFLEGYSNHVMNDAGERLLPGFARLHERFERRNEARGAMERAILKSSPLPRPDRADLFQRELRLRFRPQDQ